MTPRQLILLSPYRLPAKDSVMLADEDVASFLNGYTALWHPLALRGALEPPRIASPYDHESPTAGHVYPVPIHPLASALLGAGADGPALPEAFGRGSPLNLVASGSYLEQLAVDRPEVVGQLKERVASGQVEACVGAYVERADALLPVES